MGSAPKPDAQMGEAAKMSAQTGQEMLQWMMSQAGITNRWAEEDRARYQADFKPLEERYVAEATAAADPAKIAQNAAARSSEAVADVRQQFALQRDADTRRLTAMGVNPASGRFLSTNAGAGATEALAAAGAANTARRESILTDEARAEGKMANAINLGKGMSVNPGSAMQISNSAGGAGFQGAMSGYGQQANILNQEYQGRMQAWQSRLGGIMGLAGGLGTIAGAFLPSSKDYKTDKKPAKGMLKQVRKMPVEEWAYKPGVADGGADRHVGPYAEDFKAATGKGDGKSIPFQDMLGLTLGALRELDAKVSKLEGRAA